MKYLFFLGLFGALSCIAIPAVTNATFWATIPTVNSPEMGAVKVLGALALILGVLFVIPKMLSSR